LFWPRAGYLIVLSVTGDKPAVFGRSGFIIYQGGRLGKWRKNRYNSGIKKFEFSNFLSAESTKLRGE